MTAYAAVHCWTHGLVKITEAEYDRQMERADDLWRCPICREPACWNQTFFEAIHDDEAVYGQRETELSLDGSAEAPVGGQSVAPQTGASSDEEQEMKTIIIWDSIGEEDIKFYVVEGDHTELNNVYVNSTKHDNYSEEELEVAQDALMKLVGDFPPEARFPTNVILSFPDTKVIVAGFIP